MKFQADLPSRPNVVSAVHPDRIGVGSVVWRESVLLPWQGEVQAWAPAGFDGLRLEDFEAIAALQPELVLLGTGSRQRFPKPALLRPLMARRIGIETMNTAAACRTYNVLLSEDRAVVAALLLGG